MVWLGTFIAFVYSVLIIFSVSLTFSLDAIHKLQRQVDGWTVPLKSQPVAYYRESRTTPHLRLVFFYLRSPALGWQSVL